MGFENESQAIAKIIEQKDTNDKFESLDSNQDDKYEIHEINEWADNPEKRFALNKAIEEHFDSLIST